jgi:dihydrodipicolinate synthase/N-acetylneuraminate lyase
MTDQNNVTSDAVGITVDGVTANISPELLREWVKEANGYLAEAEAQQDEFKGLVEAIKTSTGLKKGFISKYLKSRYKQKTKAEKELGKGFEKLDEVLEA